MNKRTVDMTVGNPTKHILTFALPLILTNMGQQLYMIADAAIVGRGVGVKALAAVGATDWICWLILWTMAGVAQSFSTFVARSFGEGNRKQLNKTIVTASLLSAVIGVILTVAGLWAGKPLLLLLNTPEDILSDANTYLVTMLSGTLVVAAYNMSGSILRALGDGRSPLIAMIIAASLNVGLDCLFVFVFKWGIFGAALASVTAQTVSFLYCLNCLRKVEFIKLDKDAWTLDWAMVRQMIVFAVPVSLRFIIICLGGIILQSSINDQGSTFLAGYTATNKVYGLLECSATALGLACCTFMAQNYGAGRHDRVKIGVRSAVKVVCMMAFAVASVSILGRTPLMQLFLDTEEAGGPEALEIAIRYLIIISSSLIILYLLHIFSNALQALGIAVWSMYSGLGEFVGRVFMAKVAINWIGPNALFISEPVAWLFGLLLLMLPYFYYQKKLLKTGQ